MGIELISIKCPECGAMLEIESNRQQAFCTYCGAKVILHNENEHVFRHIDEAGIKQAETDRMVQLKHMEMAERQMQIDEKDKKFRIKLAMILGVIGAFMSILGVFLGSASGDGDSPFYYVAIFGFFAVGGAVALFGSTKKKQEEIDDGRVVVPSLSDFEKQSYVAIEAKFRSAGFTNVKCVPLNDLKMGLLKKPNMVESITINGNNTTSGGRKYYPDAAVVITYHSMG